MCGRYRFKADLSALAAHFPGLVPPARLVERFNVAPTQSAPVLVLENGKAKVRMMKWGLVPSWSKDTKAASRCINARAESVAEKPSFRSAFRHRRCLVASHGYYEWEETAHGKQPHLYSLRTDGLIAFAGLWETWKPAPSADENPPEPLETFTIITTGPNELAAKLHDRMPVILPRKTWDTWLSPNNDRDTLEALLAPCDASRMREWPVTPRMNTIRFESPECVEPLVEGGGDFRLH